MQEHWDTVRFKSYTQQTSGEFHIGNEICLIPQHHTPLSIYFHEITSWCNFFLAFWYTNSPTAAIHMEGFHWTLFAVSHWRACIPRGLHFKLCSRLPKCIRLKSSLGFVCHPWLGWYTLTGYSDMLEDAVTQAVYFWSNVFRQLHKCKFPLLWKDQ